MMTLILRDSVEELPPFTVSLNGVTLNRRVKDTSIICVQSFVCSPRFTQRDFFSDNGINLLVCAVNAAGSIRDQSTCQPRANVLPGGYEATLVDLRKAQDAVVVRRKDARIPQRGGVECAVWSRLRSVSHFVRLECGYQMLMRLGRMNNCLSLFLLGISPVVVVPQRHLEALEKESARGVRHPLSLLHPNDYLSLTTGQLFCQKEEGCVLKIQTLNAL